MVWAGFHLHGRTPLYRIRGNVTGVRYRDEIVMPQVIPTLQSMGASAILQDDNATPHRTMVVQYVLQRQQIVRMNWPARSPDLAPIEHLWDIFDAPGERQSPPPADVDQLFRFLQQEWMAIPQQMLQNHGNSMRSRIGECLSAQGGHTRY